MYGYPFSSTRPHLFSGIIWSNLCHPFVEKKFRYNLSMVHYSVYFEDVRGKFDVFTYQLIGSEVLPDPEIILESNLFALALRRMLEYFDDVFTVCVHIFPAQLNVSTGFAIDWRVMSFNVVEQLEVLSSEKPGGPTDRLPSVQCKYGWLLCHNLNLNTPRPRPLHFWQCSACHYQISH